MPVLRVILFMRFEWFAFDLKCCFHWFNQFENKRLMIDMKIFDGLKNRFPYFHREK